MNVSPRFPCPDLPARRNGFTLLEMLVATTVLALMFVMMSQLLSSISTSCQRGQQRSNNFTKARSMLDMIARDLQNIVYRPDLPAFPSSSLLAFYTLRAGIDPNSGAVRNLSLVDYEIKADSTNSVLLRKDYALTWDNSSSGIEFNQTTISKLSQTVERETTPGIVGFFVRYIYADGIVKATFPSDASDPSSASNPVRAIGITMIVLDDLALKQLSATQLASLRDTLSAAEGNQPNPKSTLENYLASDFNWNSYPASLRTGLRVFERYVSISIQSL